ncbi:DUF2334 domain-containing protein [Butyrivibrio sp. MC2013]|uniref:DUF2334 domain-containing protein n=1 Tax=Butyrivibrio sp. MC2013 TaxID=1280686 RepID=UPI000479E5D1|nr:DUF2334 domain-containing protein [Butyrivibrio sp. MC2013]
MKIAIRMDDISPDMDWDKFLNFTGLLKEHGLTALLGVVPDNRDEKLSIDPPREDFWDVIKGLSKDGFTIAMHGHTHIYTTDKGGIFPLNRKSEFAGLPYDMQCSMISDGRKILSDHGIETDIFMAPSHSYDHNTLRALSDNGFKVITDGFGDRPYSYKKITFYPISYKKSRSLKSKRDGIVTFVVHANTMTDKEYESYKRIIKEGKCVPYRELSDLSPVKAGACYRLREYLMALSKRTASDMIRLIRRK